MSKSNIEHRHYPTILKRMDGEGREVSGIASTIGVEYDMGWYYEVIMEGAFDNAIGNSDCRALFNHHADHLLARQSSNTLELSADGSGLSYRFESPKTSIGNDILVMIDRGDLKESSFAFTVKRQSWVDEKQEDGSWKYIRQIEEVDQLFDVSPVTYPANPNTSVAKRCFDNRPNKPKTEKETIGRSLQLAKRQFALID